jgi:hypothetical protein
MTALIQFIVLKREGKWVVKSKDLERVFSVQREAVDAAIRFANDSGKEGKPGVVLFQKIENQIRKDLDIRTGSLSARQIGFTHGVGDARAGKIGGHPRLGETLLHALRATSVNYQGDAR